MLVSERGQAKGTVVIVIVVATSIAAGFDVHPLVLQSDHTEHLQFIIAIGLAKRKNSIALASSLILCGTYVWALKQL